MDLSKTIAQMKKEPGFSDHVGMILAHNGVVRGRSRLNGAAIKQLEVRVNFTKLEQIRAEIARMQGIFRVEVEAVDGVRQPGDDLLLLVVAGDIREHVKRALSILLERVKAEAVMKREILLEEGE